MTAKWNVPDIEARLETLRLWRESMALDKKLQEARDAETWTQQSPEVKQALADLYEVYEAKRQELYSWYSAESQKIEGPDTTAPLEEQAEMADEAYRGAGMTIMEDEDGHPVLCVVTGVPIMEEDEVVETGDGSLILAAAFVPREILDQFKGADSDDDDVEEAA